MNTDGGTDARKGDPIDRGDIAMTAVKVKVKLKLTVPGDVKDVSYVSIANRRLLSRIGRRHLKPVISVVVVHVDPERRSVGEFDAEGLVRIEALDRPGGVVDVVLLHGRSRRRRPNELSAPESAGEES